MTGAEWNSLGVDLQGEFVSLWVFLAVPIGCVVAVKVGSPGVTGRPLIVS